MNLLEDDREQYAIGGISKILGSAATKAISKITGKGSKPKVSKKELEDQLRDLQSEMDKLMDQRMDSPEGLTGSKLDYAEEVEFLSDAVEKELRKNYPESKILKDIELKREIDQENFAMDGPKLPFAAGGLLEDDREQYVIGGAISAIKKGITKLLAKVKESAGKRQDSKRVVELRTTLKEFDDYDTMLQKKMSDDPVNTDYTEEFELLQEAKFYVESELTQFSKMNRAEGGEIQEEEELPMESENSGMLPDDEMEDEFLDYVLDTALTDQEEEMLMSKIEQDEELSMLFDKVIDVAQEFAGSGPVEGPGSGVSDSIPARLSDGEFVFTAAAVEEIGADNLMAMMKDAEMKAEERQGLVEGGMPEEEETVTMKVQEQKEPKVQIAKATVNSNRGLLDEDEISKGIKSKMMLDPLQRHVRS